MYTIFLAGGIASGKSTLAKKLEERGAIRIDLDELSRDVLAPGEPVLQEIAAAFGEDLLDKNGVLDRKALAQRAFSTKEGTKLLEQIELPHIKDALVNTLCLMKEEQSGDTLVVEIPRLDNMDDCMQFANEVIVVLAPLEKRLERSRQKGMSPVDFSERASLQLNEDELRERANYVVVNNGSQEKLNGVADEIMKRASRIGPTSVEVWPM